VPIVVWGSALVLKVVERFPSIVYLGSGVLVWTSAKMMSSEPLLAPWFEAVPIAKPIVYLAIPLVLWAGFVKNHRRFESRIHARLTEFAKLRPLGVSSPASNVQPVVAMKGEKVMLKVLIPVEGSENSMRAVRHAIAEYRRHHELELHLLNVQPQLSRHIARFVKRDDRDKWHRDQADKALADARKLLDVEGVPHQVHWALGDRASEICRTAARIGAHHVVMGTARKNSITRMLEDSVTDRVLQTTTIPVEVIAGKAISRWESWGVPAGVVGVGGLMLLAAS
jgi:nucleotide-binding universal stress UspA family protein